jgi:monoterpene epsilon-lactone hydrolase
MSTEQREAIDRFYRQSTIDGSTPAELRGGFAQTMAHFATPEGTTTTDTTLGGRRALRISPTANHTSGTILYFHGGGFMLGSPETALPATAALVLRTGFTALSVDYRLAPRTPIPPQPRTHSTLTANSSTKGSTPELLWWQGTQPEDGWPSSPRWRRGTPVCPHRGSS